MVGIKTILYYYNCLIITSGIFLRAINEYVPEIRPANDLIFLSTISTLQARYLLYC